MWILTRENNSDVFYIKNNSKNIVGRNVGDLPFPNDKSISRKHATICLNNDSVTIEDHGSKYGTYIDAGIQTQTKVNSDVQIPLSNNSHVMFGLLGNEWVLIKKVFKTCVSTIKESDLMSFKAQCEKLGVILTKDWSKDCTHLTMPSITLTLKVVLALVQNKPIVKPEYWTECLRCWNSNLPLPSSNSFLPDIQESSISQQANFNIDENRKSVFANKKFIFMSRQQMKNYEDVIESAGGECGYLGRGNITHGQLCAPHTVLIEHSFGYKCSQESQMLQTKLDNITKYMASKKKRIIPEVEIGLSVLYVSTEKYCNPSFNFASVIIATNKTDVIQSTEMLAPETQDITTTPTPALPPRFVDETLSSSNIKDKLTPTPTTSGTRSTTKRLASMSPSGPEPSAKKSNISLDIKTTSSFEDDKSLFNFVQDDACSFSKPKHKEVELTLQSVRRKRKDLECDGENLFAFVPDTDKSYEQTKRFKSHDQSAAKEAPLLNIGKHLKKQCRSVDSPDGKKMSIVTPTSSIRNASLVGPKYTCQKKTSTIVKDEDEVISKLKDLDIQPAVVVACTNLAVRRDISDTRQSNHSSTVTDCKRNFKKFVKVRPQITHNRIVSADMLTEYQPKNANAAIPQQFLAESSEDENDDNFRSFAMNRPKSSRGRSRRL